MFGFKNVPDTQTDYVLVPAVPKHRIRVRAYVLQTGAVATDVTFNSKGSGAGTPISMTHQCGPNGGAVVPDSGCEQGWFQTNEGEALTVTTSAGSVTGIQYVYDLVRISFD